MKYCGNSSGGCVKRSGSRQLDSLRYNVVMEWPELDRDVCILTHHMSVKLVKNMNGKHFLVVITIRECFRVSKRRPPWEKT